MAAATSPSGFAAVVLSGGTGARLGGADKAALEVGGRTLLVRALEAVAGAEEIVVVGPTVGIVDPAAAAVRFVVEDPPGGGPAAGLLAGLAALAPGSPLVVVLAVDMPYVGPATVARLLDALAADGRRRRGPAPWTAPSWSTRAVVASSRGCSGPNGCTLPTTGTGCPSTVSSTA